MFMVLAPTYGRVSAPLYIKDVLRLRMTYLGHPVL